MSRLGVVRWHTSTPGFDNHSANGTSPGLFPLRDDWLQADMILSLAMVAALTAHVHYCRVSKVGISAVLALASLLVSLVLAPLVGSVLLVCACYRRLVSSWLHLTEGRKFAGLLEGTDAFWAIEEDTSRSVINILAMADFSFIVSASTQEDEPLQTITELIQDRLLAASSSFPKLCCHRKYSKFGYVYWVKEDFMDISDYVHWMDIEDQGDQTITESTLKNFVSLVTNAPLPSGHRSGWEILVGKYPIKPSSDLLDAMENGGWITKSCAGIRYPVLFRVHHSIGDGVALVNLLLDSLGDPCSRSSTPITYRRNSSPTFDKNFVRPSTPSLSEEDVEHTVVTSWQESDIPKHLNSYSPNCDFKSFFVNIPLESNQILYKKYHDSSKRSGFFKSQCSYSINELKNSVKSVCRRVLKFVEQTKDFKKKLNEKEIKDFEIIVNDRPGEEFLEMIKNATSFEIRNDSSERQKITNKHFWFTLNKSTKLLSLIANKMVNVIECWKNLFKQWTVLLFAPAALINQAIAQNQDVNTLHGPRLSGQKVVAWYLEQQDNPDQLLMSMIKRIRSKTGVKFSDVLLTAVSESLESFYSQCNETPKFITVVIPTLLGLPMDAKASTKVIKSRNFSAKITKITERVGNKLENRFSVAMLPLPIANSCCSKLKLFYKLRQVRKHCEVLRNSPDYLINYWLLRVVATLLPTWFLTPLLRSTHSTLVISNLPGPTRLTKLAGHTLHDLVFWVPNRTTTGVGVTVLSYAGRLQLGLIADRALIACQQDAQTILDNVALSIQLMDQLSSPT